MRIVVIDVETTGLSPLGGDRIVEIGAVKIENGAVKQEFSSLVNPGIRMSISAGKINGITDEMLEDAPDPEIVFSKFSRFVGNACIVAHNASFDLSFIRAEMARLGFGFNPPHQCALRLSRRRFPELPNYRLITVARHVLGSLPENLHLHRALDDARLVAQMWLEMMKNE